MVRKAGIQVKTIVQEWAWSGTIVKVNSIVIHLRMYPERAISLCKLKKDPDMEGEYLVK